MELSVWSYAAAVGGGAAFGLLLAVFGGGGSVLAAPLLVYVVGVRDPHVAIGTSAAAVAVNAAAALAVQARSGRVKWRCAAVFGGAGVIGTLVGAHFAKLMDGQKLLFLYAMAMAAVGLAMLAPGGDGGDAEARLTRSATAKLAPAGLVTGLASGFFGIGGGFLIVPCLMAAGGLTMANATASSLVSVTLFGAATSASYAASGLVDPRVFLALVAGGAVGALAGGRLAHALARHALMARRLFALMVLAMAVYVAIRARG